MPDPQRVENQINFPQVQGNLVIQGDAVIYESGYQAPRVLNGLPRVPTSLLGRESELATLHRQLEDGQTVLLTGLGGVGKTALAATYLQIHRAALAHIVWIEQTGDFSTILPADRLLVKNLRIDLSGQAEQDTRMMLNALGALGGPSLLVIDNAETDIERYESYLPGGTDWRVIITSREQLAVGETLAIDLLSEAAAIDLFRYHYESPKQLPEKKTTSRSAELRAHRAISDAGEVPKKITAILGYHALTIELVAKTARARRIQPAEKLLALLEERGLKLGRKAGIKTDHAGFQTVEQVFPYLQSVFSWREENELEDYLMKQFVALPPVEIAFSLLTDLLQIDEDQEEIWDEFTMALDGLTQRGWLQRDDEADSYQMHRVVQAVLAERLASDLEREDLRRLILSLARKLGDTENPLDKVAWLPFAERLHEVVPAAWLAYPEFFYLNEYLAELYRNLWQFQQAKAVLEILDGYASQSLEPDDERRITVHGSLATVYVQTGEYGKAEPMLRRLMSQELQGEQPRPVELAKLLSSLGTILLEQGKFQEAVDQFEAAVDLTRQVMGEDDPAVLTTQSNLIAAYAAVGRHQDSVSLVHELWSASQRILGHDHPDTRNRQLNAGSIFYEYGMQDQAEALLRDHLKWCYDHFGADHPATAQSAATLGVALAQTERVEEAVKLLEIAVRTYLHTYEPGHLGTLDAMMNLAAAYQSQGRREDKPELIQRALEDLQMALRLTLDHHPADHPLAQRIKGNLAVVYADFGRFQEAKNLLAEVYDTQSQKLGPDHPSTQNTLANLRAVEAKI